MAWQDLSDEELEAQIREARARAIEDARIEPRAVRVWYDPQAKLVMFELRNGCVFGFPPKIHPYWGLADATEEELARGEVLGDGDGIGWDELDAHISVPGLMFELLNVKAWYAKWLGSATSEAKAAAARENGKKGGRPRAKAPAAGRKSRNGATGGD
jgi:hypothetical protein